MHEEIKPEIELLRKILSNQSIARQVLPVIEPIAANAFDTSTAIIIGYIDKYNNKYDSLPVKSTACFDLEKQGSEVINIIDEIYQPANDGVPIAWLEDKVLSSYKKGQINTLSDALKFGKDVEQTISEINRISHLTFTKPNFLLSTLTIDMKALFTNITRYETPWAKLNAMYYGGIAAGTTTSIGGVSNDGKSLFLANIAIFQANLGSNVAYFSLENTKDQDMLRFVQIYNKFDRDQAMVAIGLDQAVIPKFYYGQRADLIDGELTTQDIDTMITNQRFQIVVIDYIGELSPIASDEKLEEHQRLKRIASQLKKIALKHNVAIITAHQLSRAAYASKDNGLDTTSGSFSMNHSFDSIWNIVNYKDDTSEYLHKIKTLNVVKNREGEKGRIDIQMQTSLVMIEVQNGTNFDDFEDDLSVLDDESISITTRPKRGGKR